MIFFRKLWAFFDTEIIGLNIGIWFFIELVMCIRNWKFKDYVSRFVEMDLLVAQFLATAAFFVVALVVAFREGRSATGAVIQGKSFDNLNIVKAEIIKVPIFFGWAAFISGIAKAIESGVAMGAGNNWSHWLSNLQPSLFVVGVGLALFTFAGLIAKF